MDFIDGLPKSHNWTSIMVVVDRLSKYAHFLPLKHPYTAQSVAQQFTKEIIRLHGLPVNIISDRDPIFCSNFWQEIFTLQGVILNMSTAYHPQSDGQSEVVNRCLETNLRCFCCQQPANWADWLCWAEYYYNTTYHSAIKMTPYEALYGVPPPTFLSYIPGLADNNMVDAQLRSRQEILQELQHNLEAAQNKMVKYANKHRLHVEYQVGDWVYLKLQPYRQDSMVRRHCHKLSARYFGPYQIVKRCGKVAYQLDLPEEARIHHTFHVSQLKRKHGPYPVFPTPLPHLLCAQDRVPNRILQRRLVRRHNQAIPQVLISWDGAPASEATWMDYTAFKQQYPATNLEDEVVSPGGGS